MVSRLVASLVLLAAVVLVAVVILGDEEAPVTTTSDSTEGSDGMVRPAESAVPEADAPAREPTPIEAPENLGPRRDLVNLDGWLNTDIAALSELDGKVVLVEMWTFGCRNCKARIPHNQDLYARLSRDDFEIVGVHAPEFSYEAELANIEQALVDLGVTWPVALDTEKENFRAWQPGGRRFWPRTFLVDQNGDVRFDHIGEGKYDELSQTIDWLIANPPA